MRICIFLAAALLALPVSAQEPATPAATAAEDSACVSISRIAESYMRQRQRGVPMREAMSTAEAAPPQISGMMKAIVIEAYKEHGYKSPGAQQNVITEFGNDAYMACMLP